MGRRKPEIEKQWREHVEACAQSKLGVREYCRAHGLRENSFYGWRRELARRDGAPCEVPTREGRPNAPRRRRPTFVEVAAPVTSVLEVAPDGTVRVPLELEPDRLTMVLEAIAQARTAC